MISLDQKAVKPEFTPSQAKAVDNIISFIAEDFNKLRNVQALSGPGGTGKALPIDTKVRYKDGWKRIIDCQVGDEIVTPNGNLTKITGVYPQGIRPCYMIIFKSGKSIIADENHLWIVRTKKLLKTYRLSLIHISEPTRH